MSASENTNLTSSQIPQPSIRDFREAYDQADRLAKEVENFSDTVSIPAHNELRNAGRHLLDSLSDDGKVVKPQQLLKGISHCRRAMWEAADAGMLHALDLIHMFKTDYNEEPITYVVPNWLEILKTAREAQRHTDGKRAPLDTDPDSGTVPHDTFVDCYRSLRDSAEYLDDARDEMNKRIRLHQKESRRFLVNIGLVVLGIVVSVGTAIVVAVFLT